MRCQKIIYIIACILIFAGVLFGKQVGVIEMRVVICGALMVFTLGIYKLIFDEFK